MDKTFILEALNVKGFKRVFGLMFSSRNSRNLLFEFKKYNRTLFTSYFVFFKFLILWLDEHNNVLDFEIVEPFKSCIYSKYKFRRVLEVPFNEVNSDLINFFVEKRKI